MFTYNSNIKLHNKNALRCNSWTFRMSVKCIQMLIPDFCGGMGNMMFQLASIYSLSKQTGHTFGFDSIPLPPQKHSYIDYTSNIFRPWMQYMLPIKHTVEYTENNSYESILNDLRRIPTHEIVRMKGYYQNTLHIEPHKDEIVKLFDLPLQNKYYDTEDAYFLHVRRGDYVNNTYHEMDLSNYYKRAIEHIGRGVAYVVSNDIAWCESWSMLNDIRYRIVNENEVNTLALMKQCQIGGIGVNSSFSWWGLYLNTNRPHLIIPDRWYPRNDYPHFNYSFDGAKIMPV